MDLLLERLTSDADSSIGTLFEQRMFLGFTCEDEHRATKVMHETRIPPGTYDLRLRAEGGFHERYRARFGEAWHRGMLHLQNVPGFEHVLIHCGNTDDDTSGCVLVGRTATVNKLGGGTIGDSLGAYTMMYPRVRDALLRGERVRLTIVERDR